MSKIGIVSDTHNLFDPKIPKLFAGVDHILHAGDIGLPWILLELEDLAPVTAVGGNTDDPALRYKQTAVVNLAERTFLIHHIVAPHNLEDSLKQRITREKPDVVVFGHTHKPFSESIGGVLYFNPGYSGPSRFGMPRTIAILRCDQKGMRAEYLPL
jgi:putative phosphoesterase